MENFKLKYLPTLLMLVVCISTAKADMVLSDTNDKFSIAEIKFSKELTLENTISLLSDTDANIAIIQSQYEFNGQTVTEFYTPPQSTYARDIHAYSLKNEYTDYRKSLALAILENSTFDKALELDDSAKESIDAILRSSEPSSINITGVTLTGDRNELSKVGTQNNVKTIDITTIDNIKKNAKKASLTKKTNSNSEKSSTNWLPDEGFTFLNQSTVSTRYSLQYMKWSNNNFDLDDTYEHDFFLNNYNNNLGTYLTLNSSTPPSCMPSHTYWSTTMPPLSAPYLDTRLDQNGLCSTKEVPYTIGAAIAVALPANTLMFTYFVANNGTVVNDKYKLTGQKGIRLPFWCYSTWCSFGTEQANIIPAWRSGTPTAYAW